MIGIVAWFIEVLLAIPVFLYRWLFGKPTLPAAGKCVVITGCDSGIGLTIALTACKLGFEVVATCLDLNGDGAQLLKNSSSSACIVQMDVTKPESIDKALEHVNTHLTRTGSKLWALVNNAGLLVYGHFDWQLESQIKAQLEVNVMGVMRSTKAFLPLIRRAKGRVINITSANGHWCLPGLSVYCGTKHAVEGFTNSLRMEMLPWGVEVILINPGNIPKGTRIMARQAEYLEEMKKKFTDEQSEVYGEYFDRFGQYLKKIFPDDVTNSQQPLDDNGLKKIVESALMCQQPKHYYQNLSLGFRLFILSTKFLPAYWSDRFMVWMWSAAVGHKLL